MSRDNENAPQAEGASRGGTGQVATLLSYSSLAQIGLSKPLPFNRPVSRELDGLEVRLCRLAAVSATLCREYEHYPDERIPPILAQLHRAYSESERRKVEIERMAGL